MSFSRHWRVKGYDNAVGFLFPDDLEEHIGEPVDSIRRKALRVCESPYGIVCPIDIGVAVYKVKVHRRLYLIMRLFVAPEDGEYIIDNGAARVITSMDMDEKTRKLYKRRGK